MSEIPDPYANESEQDMIDRNKDVGYGYQCASVGDGLWILDPSKENSDRMDELRRTGGETMSRAAMIEQAGGKFYEHCTIPPRASHQPFLHSSQHGAE
jgi:hypothetical protein